MKKRLCTALAGITLLTASLPAMTWAAETAITVYVDGQQVVFDVAPITEADRTLVPMRVIFEKLGATVTWDEETQTASAVRGDVTISFTIDDPIMLKNNLPVTLDVPARKLNDRTLVPLRAVSEALSCQVDWNEETQQVTISTNPASIETISNGQYTVVYAGGDHPRLISALQGGWIIPIPGDWMPLNESDGNNIYCNLIDGDMHTLYVQIRDTSTVSDEVVMAEITNIIKERLEYFKTSGERILLKNTGLEPVTKNGRTFYKVQTHSQLVNTNLFFHDTTYFLLHNGFLLEFGYAAPTEDTSVIDQVIEDSVFK